MKLLEHTDLRSKIYLSVGIAAIPVCIAALLFGVLLGLKAHYAPMAILMILSAASAYGAPVFIIAFADRRLALRIGHVALGEGLMLFSEISARLFLKEEAVRAIAEKGEKRGLYPELMLGECGFSRKPIIGEEKITENEE